MSNILDFSQLFQVLNSGDWSEHNIEKKENEHLTLVSTQRGFKGEGDIHLQANGLILDKSSSSVVCACEPKMTDVSEEFIKELLNDRNKKVRFEYCEDGTVIRLYNYNDQWFTATSRCINAKDSYWTSEKTFDQLFWEVFDDKWLEHLDKTCTYVFILLHKENRIVVKHNINALLFIGRISNVSDNKHGNGILTEYYENVFREFNSPAIRRPKSLPYVDIRNFKTEDYFHPMKRGLIIKVLDGNVWKGYKIDFSEFLKLKALRGNVPHIGMRYLELLNDPVELAELQKAFWEYRNLFADIRTSLNKQIKTIHKLYIDSHVKHSTQVDESNMYFRTLKQLHAQYKATSKPITFEDVQTKLFTLDKNVLKRFLAW